MKLLNLNLNERENIKKSILISNIKKVKKNTMQLSKGSNYSLNFGVNLQKCQIVKCFIVLTKRRKTECKIIRIHLIYWVKIFAIPKSNDALGGM